MTGRSRLAAGALLVTLGAIPVLFGNDIVRTLKLHHRHTTFVTTSGLTTATFFAGLQSDQRIRDWVRQIPKPREHSCGKKASAFRRFISSLGVIPVVYAQD